jgi:hypothetical protein
MSRLSSTEAVLGPPAASSRAVDLDRIRLVLDASPSRTHFVLEDGVGDEELTPAAVLFPIVQRMEGPTVLLTQRTAHLKDHPGQISFPGGRREPADLSPAHTALREATEEIGLSPGACRDRRLSARIPDQYRLSGHPGGGHGDAAF